MNRLAFLSIALALPFAIPKSASALSIVVTNPPYSVPDTTNVNGYIGIARPSGGTLRPYMCLYRSGSETSILLNTSAVSNLTETVNLHFNNAGNSVTFHRGGGVPADRDCGLVDWAPLNFAGYTVAVNLYGNGSSYYNSDSVSGNSGSGQLLVVGGAGIDAVYLYGPVATVTTFGGNDDVRSLVLHTSGGIQTGAGDDCIYLLDSDSVGAGLSNCQTGAYDIGNPFGVITGCELAIPVIGFCDFG